MNLPPDVQSEGVKFLLLVGSVVLNHLNEIWMVRRESSQALISFKGHESAEDASNEHELANIVEHLDASFIKDDVLQKRTQQINDWRDQLSDLDRLETIAIQQNLRIPDDVALDLKLQGFNKDRKRIKGLLQKHIQELGLTVKVEKNSKSG